MELVREFRAKLRNKTEHLNSEEISLNSDTLLIIKFPDPRVLRIVSRSVFLTLVILALHSIGLIAQELSRSYPNVSDYGSGSDSVNFELLHLLFRDLSDEGLLKASDNAVIVCSGVRDLVDSARLSNRNVIDIVMEYDLAFQSSIADETFDFAFTSSFHTTKFVDRALKIGGIVAVPLRNNALSAFQELPNYKIVYLRRYNSTVVALRKTGMSEDFVTSGTKGRLCTAASEIKKEALKGLEDALLEPPLANSNKHLQENKYLPDLLGDSLKTYPRRIFINVGLPNEDGANMEWFHQNYPSRNQNFEMYDLKMAMEELASKVYPAPIGISDWLKRNVREEEFVVMKAEAGVVEEMIEEKTICLVDELFLECDNLRHGGETNKSRRAYWQCLALNGRLRDEGVAVHQWWG